MHILDFIHTSMVDLDEADPVTQALKTRGRVTHLATVSTSEDLDKLVDGRDTPDLIWLRDVEWVVDQAHVVLAAAARGANLLFTAFPSAPDRVVHLNKKFLHAFDLHLYTRDESKWISVLENARFEPWTPEIERIDRTHPVGAALQVLPVVTDAVASGCWGQGRNLVPFPSQPMAMQSNFPSGDIVHPTLRNTGLVTASQLVPGARGGKIVITVGSHNFYPGTGNGTVVDAALDWLLGT